MRNNNSDQQLYQKQKLITSFHSQKTTISVKNKQYLSMNTTDETKLTSSSNLALSNSLFLVNNNTNTNILDISSIKQQKRNKCEQCRILKYRMKLDYHNTFHRSPSKSPSRCSKSLQ